MLHCVAEALRWLFGRKRPFAFLRITLRGELAETAPAGFWSTVHPRTFAELVIALNWARNDERIRAVFVHCEQAVLGWAQTQELHRSLMALRQAGKRVYVALGQASTPEYVLASAADQIFLSPAGSLALAGLNAEVWFFARALAKLGIQPEIVQVGEYKTAAEVFTATQMSAAHREATQALVDAILHTITEAVARGRGWDVEQVRELLEGGPYDAQAAMGNKLVDALEDPTSAEAKVLEYLGLTQSQGIDFHAYTHRRALELRRLWWRYRGQHIAVVHIAGSLFESPIAHSRIASLLRDLEQLKDAANVLAVVVRVASPGGSAFAADRLWHALLRVAERKPVVTSCGDVAASGGYYVALVGKPLFAEATSIMGSIGVLSGRFVLREFYHWLGIDKDRVVRGKHPGLTSDVLPLTPQERSLLERHAQSFYRRFLEVVGMARELSEQEVEASARGRIWSGTAALERGLIDALGGLEQALDAAKLLAGFDPKTALPIVHYPRPRPVWQSLLERLQPTPPIPLPPMGWSIPSEVLAWMPVRYRVY